MARLWDITGQGTGIIIYDDESVGVYNWEQLDDAQVPLLSPLGLPMGWPCSEMEGEIDVEATYVDDIRTILPGKCWYDDDEEALDTDMDIVYDKYGDLPALYGYDIGLGTLLELDDNGNLMPTSGAVYKIGEYTIIAPSSWQ